MLSMLKPEMINQSHDLIVSQRRSNRDKAEQEERNQSMAELPERDPNEEERRPSTAHILPEINVAKP